MHLTTNVHVVALYSLWLEVMHVLFIYYCNNYYDYACVYVNAWMNVLDLNDPSKVPSFELKMQHTLKNLLNLQMFVDKPLKVINWHLFMYYIASACMILCKANSLWHSYVCPSLCDVKFKILLYINIIISSFYNMYICDWIFIKPFQTTNYQIWIISSYFIKARSCTYSFLS